MNDMPAWLTQLWNVVVFLFPLVLWFCFWTFAVNWQKLRPVLAQGAWAPLVLLAYISAEVWSQISPSPGVVLPNFWWQLGVVSGLIFLAFCGGWLQDSRKWAPHEIDIDRVSEDHGHAHH